MLQLFVVLMSDLLLLTRVEQDNSLLVVDYPILLHDIVEPDWTDTTSKYNSIVLADHVLCLLPFKSVHCPR